PNAFSPNFDGVNDYFMLQDEGDVVDVRYLRVYSRWGERVFERSGFLPNTIEDAWDGTFRGERMNPGVYTWLAEILFRDGTVEQRAGAVHLIR
ncbi:MAG: gliding motility-associated C-terminal domain-containing protein, partial [Phaeodactylibacter sp.]|nr:gliding motility-associated C-terminal domain-containing protein [Phaeodactylibacter sp.]